MLNIEMKDFLENEDTSDFSHTRMTVSYTHLDVYKRQQKNVREKDFDIDNFLNVLEPYYRGGEYDYLLNSDKELDLSLIHICG